ncbi:DNA/RNA polymerase [Trichodelitschia bisporula]|uniref:DNA polymerase kappa n=1 Tax=Trichodelitschia bisporula TaxID=703511 RepID=A0A6G1I3N7_9PEZI|nr:DNA/RNA polymerase [Trichodelitschia bisporula]
MDRRLSDDENGARDVSQSPTTEPKQDIDTVKPEADEGIVTGPAVPAQASTEQLNALTHRLLGPSLTKSGQEGVSQDNVSQVILDASKGSKFYEREAALAAGLATRVAALQTRKAKLEAQDLRVHLRNADAFLASLESSRDLSRIIVHLDCDAFYAAVAALKDPTLKGIPFAVGGSVLSTCSYEARKFGVRSAMPAFVARKLCPELKLVDQDFPSYIAKAGEIRAILQTYDPNFQPAGLDESYLDLTAYCQDNDISASDAVSKLRTEVREKCGITISAGIAATAPLAKIAGNVNKPDGQFEIPSTREAVMAYMADLSVRKVAGIGRVLQCELDAVGIRVCADIYPQRALLVPLFGDKTAKFLLTSYLGIGRTRIAPSDGRDRKSVGTEGTFADLAGAQALRTKLRQTAEALEEDMKQAGVKGRTVVLKVKLHTFEVLTRQVGTHIPVWTKDDIYRISLPMLERLEKEIPGLKIRLLGLRCTHLVEAKLSVDKNFFGAAKAPNTEERFCVCQDDQILAPAVPPPERASAHRAEGSRSGVPVDEDGWEIWPEAEFEAAAEQERKEEFEELLKLSQELEERHDQDNGAKAPLESSRSTSPADDVESWACPICNRPQPADERALNEHIDLCLSRETIREVVRSVPENKAPAKLEKPTLPSKQVPRKRARPRGGGSISKSNHEQSNAKRRAFFS